MPQGVYRKKSKRGNWMYFRNGKIISKSSYDMSKSRSKKRNGNSKPRKANNKKRSNGRMKKGIPHPSVTGMASGLAIASYLNQGKTVTGSFGKTSVVEGVLKDVTDGQIGTALTTLANNSVNMIGTDGGRKTLVGASLVAIAGAFARSRFPNLKLGGSKLYFRI